MRLTLALLVVAACQNTPKSEPTPNASSVPASSAAAPSPPAPKAPSKAWFEGAWRGAFQAELFRMEVPAGGVKEWKTDDGARASGPGELSLEVGADGTVTGSGKGALGELTVTGRFEGDRAALALAPATPGGFQGVLLATRTGERLEGTLSASSGDSLQVRRAAVTLTRAGQ